MHPAQRGFGLALLLCSLLWIVAPAPAAAQVDLITNGSFDMDVAGWTPLEAYMSIAFDPDDVDAAEDSGSARVVFNNTIVDDVGHVLQCVSVLPGGVYEGSSSFRIPTGQQRTGTAGMRVSWYTSNDCSGFSASIAFGPSSGIEGPWLDLAPSQFVAPAGIFSATVELEIDKPQLGGSLVVFFDDVQFLPEPSAGLAAVTALALVAGLGLLRRRG